MRTLSAAILAALVPCLVSAQTYTIQTVVGGGVPQNLPATFASLGTVDGVAADADGNFYVSSSTYSVVWKVDGGGNLTLIAGSGTPGFSGDNGPATSAQLSSPRGIALDGAGNLYIADSDNHRIRKVSAGTITTVAGLGTAGYSGDAGSALTAQMRLPWAVAIDGAGTTLYIADSGNHVIRRVSGGNIATVAGTGVQGIGTGASVPATTNPLNGPQGVALDGSGNIYISDTGNSAVWKVTGTTISLVTGIGQAGFNGDGAAAGAAVNHPVGIMVDGSGNIYIADTDNTRIRRVSGVSISTFAGTVGGFNGDGAAATSAQLNAPVAVAIDGSGRIVIADSVNNRVRRVAGGTITTVAGIGTAGIVGDNGPAIGSQLNFATATAFAPNGDLYIADASNSRVRKVSNGTISLVAGTGTAGFSGDNGDAASAAVSFPTGIAVDGSGNVYVSDPGTSRVRKIAGGIITTVAGNGTGGFSGDNGAATSAALDQPFSIAVNAAGELFIGDFGNNRIRKVSGGTITTIAGTGTPGFSGDNGSPTSAQLNGPAGLWFDAAENLYFADYFNNRVRMISNGVITTVAGNGTAGFAGDSGPATGAQLNGPLGVAVDPSGNVFISDSINNRIRKVSGGTITTVAGTGVAAFGGDGGPGTNAQVNNTWALTADALGRIYVSDAGNNVIRLLSVPCSNNVLPTSINATAAGGTFPVTIQTTPACSWSTTGLPDWIAVSGAPSGSGNGTVNLVVAANPGIARNVNVTVAGTTIGVAQAAVPVCSYSLSSLGQVFGAAGGSGTINITAGGGCGWTAAITSAVFANITSTTSGTANGTVTYTVPANGGAARNGTLTVAGQTYTIVQGAVSVGGLVNAGSIAQLAVGGPANWKTTLTFPNLGASAATVRISFTGNSNPQASSPGAPLALPLSFPQAPACTGNSAGPILAATFDCTIPAGGVLIVESSSPGSAQTAEGWAQLQSTGTVPAFVTYGYTIGSFQSEALVSLETRSASTYVVPFDNTNGLASGVALVGIVNQSLNIAVKVRDDTGTAILDTALPTLNPLEHIAFVLTDKYPIAAGKRGTVEFTSAAPGQISVVGLRFTPLGALSTTPVQSK